MQRKPRFELVSVQFWSELLYKVFFNYFAVDFVSAIDEEEWNNAEGGCSCQCTMCDVVAGIKFSQSRILYLLLMYANSSSKVTSLSNILFVASSTF